MDLVKSSKIQWQARSRDRIPYGDVYDNETEKTSRYTTKLSTVGMVEPHAKKYM